jgi:hypothetical protein
LIATYFGLRARACVLGGGFWFPGRWRVTRTKDPITFWFVVVVYGAIAIVIAMAAGVGFLSEFHRISN